MPVQKNKTTALRFIRYWLPVIIYAVFIFCLSSIPGQYTPKLFVYQDVIFHIVEYAIFALLINRAFKEYYPRIPFLRRFLWIFFVSIIYALNDEFHQIFVPNRFASMYDIAYDGIGIFISNFFYQ